MSQVAHLFFAAQHADELYSYAQMEDGSWAVRGPPVVLVNESSATHGRPGENLAHMVQAINSTHSDMVKFGRRDHAYHIVLGFLLDFVDSAGEVIKKRFHHVDGRSA